MTMKVIESIGAMRKWVAEQQRDGRKIGFVPTMGYLHEGHLSLMRRAHELSDSVVVSIYVNPEQFAPNEDLDNYPRDLKRDLELCRKENAAAVFTPDNTMMYGTHFQTYVENHALSSRLCGITRPTHFRGVATVVCKLLNIVEADVAVFGQKDAQQALIIRNMVRDLNFKTHIEVAPIVREKDGLAMSSRNKYLSAEERKEALILSRCLEKARQRFVRERPDLQELKQELQNDINSLEHCRVDYVEFVNADTLQQDFKSGDEVLLALAVFVGQTRLIDNTLLTS